MINSRYLDALVLGNVSRKKFFSILVLLSLACVFIYGVMLTPYVFNKFFGGFEQTHLASLVFFLFYNLLLMVLLPALLARFVLRERLSNLGLCWPRKKLQAFIFILLALTFIIPFIYFFSRQQVFLTYYAFGHEQVYKLAAFMIFAMPIYYLTEEFFFRGFLFLVLWQRVRWHSFWLTDVFFMLSHFGKPGWEILLCIPVGIILNVLTLITRSIFPALITHYTTGVTLLLLVRLS